MNNLVVSRNLNSIVDQVYALIGSKTRGNMIGKRYRFIDAFNPF